MVGRLREGGGVVWDDCLCFVVLADLGLLEEDMRWGGSGEFKRMQCGGECRFELKGRFDEWSCGGRAA